MDKTTQLDPEDLAVLAALTGGGERTQDLSRSVVTDVTLALAEATLSLPAVPPDATLILSSGGTPSGEADVTRALPPLAPSSQPAAPPSHAVVCTPPGGDLERRAARRARAVAVLVTRSDGGPLTRFRITPPGGPDAPPGLVVYPRRLRDDCIRVDIAWLPPYPAKPAGGAVNKAGPIAVTAFRVHVDGVSETIPVRLFANGRRPAVEAAPPAPNSGGARVPDNDGLGSAPNPSDINFPAPPELGAGGADNAGAPRPENACGVFLASELAAALGPPPVADAVKTMSTPLLVPRWARPVLMGGASVAVLGLLLFALSSGPAHQQSVANGTPGLLVSSARPGDAPPVTPPAVLAPPGFVAAGTRRPDSGAVAVVEAVDRWDEKIALWRVAGRNGATFPRVVVDTRNRASQPGAVLTRLVTRPADLPAALVLTGGLTLSPRGTEPLQLTTGGPRSGRRPRGALLLLARRGGTPFLRPLRRADTGRFWAVHLSRPIHVGRGRYSLLLSPRAVSLAPLLTPAGPRLPGCVLSERGLKTWTPGDPLPPAATRTVVPLPGFSVRAFVIEAAAFAAPAAAPLR